MGCCRIIRPLLQGLLVAGLVFPAMANHAESDGKVTDKIAVQAQKVPKNDVALPVDYPSLCKMAEVHQDWAAAWGFAEKWAASGDAEVRKNGIRKLLELSFIRTGADPEKLMTMAAEAGLPPVELQLYQVRTLLQSRNYRRAAQLLEKLVADTRLDREYVSRATHLLTLVRLGEKDYAAAAKLAERRMIIASDEAERFQSACYRVYALAEMDPEGAQTLLNSLTAAYPGDAAELADMQLFLIAKRGDWKEFSARFAARGGSGKGTFWYIAACRTAAEQAEKAARWQDAVKMRRAALQAAVNDEDRKLTVLELLAALDRMQAWKNMAETLELYLSWYPESADRQKLQLQAARYLVKAGDMPGALKWYDIILADPSSPAAGRFAAAMEAAEQCSAGNLPEEELKYRQSAVRHAADPAANQEACFRLGAYYDRVGSHKLAQESYRMAAEEKGPLQEKARLFRLQSLIRSKDYTEALTVAADLCKAKTPDFRAAAHYHLASLYEKTGDTARAAKAYQQFAKDFPQSEFAAPALYNAALIAESGNDPAETIRRLQAFLEFAPKHELAPNALYKLMGVLQESGRVEDAAGAAETLARDFPASLFTAAALFRLVDRAAAGNRHGAALEYLARIDALPIQHTGIRARVLFDRASIHAKLDNPRKALELLEKLLTAHAADPTAADAAELAGYLSAMLGEYVQGAAFYARAAQLRPGGVFAFGCMERRADCLFAAFFGRGGTAEQLRQAEAEYRSLLEKGRAYAPLLFKIGRCREAADDVQGALRIYSESLYRQAADRRAGVAPDPVWAPKTLYAAIHLIRGRQRSLEGARSALRLIALARQIGLPVDRGMEAVEQELQAKYKL